MGGICNGVENGFNSKTNVYCEWLMGKDCPVQLKGNYLWIFGDAEINETRDMEHLQCVIDLSSLKSYSFDEDVRNNAWKWELKLNSRLQESNTKIMLFAETDTSLTEHILALLHKYNTKQLQQNESTETDDEKAPETPQTQEREREPDTTNGNILFASYLMYEDVPYYAVLRDMKLQLFADYYCFVNHHNNNTIDFNDPSSMKTFDILSEFEQCVAEHEKNGKYYNMNKYAFHLICKTKDRDDNHNNHNNHNNRNNTSIAFASFSNNDRFEFCLHLDFCLAFKCMPNTFLSPELSRFDKTQIKNKLNETHAPLMQQISKMYSEYQENEDNNNNNNSTDKLRVFDAIFRVWHKTKTIEEYLKQQSGNVEHATATTTETDATFPEFQSVLQSINVPPSTIMSLYSIVLQKRTQYGKARCNAGTKCCSYVHYRRDRRNERHIQIDHNSNDISNIDIEIDVALSFIRQTQEHCIVNDLCKIHALLYAHHDEEEEEEEKAENVNAHTVCVNVNANVNTETSLDNDIKVDDNDESDNEIYSDHKPNAPSNVNDDKFIITAEQTKDGKFGYGLVCHYWRYFKHAVNFVFPVHGSLLDEVCFNKQIASRFCITLTQFWTFYLKALYLRNIFKEFGSTTIGPQAL